jgi:hypothetical protein
VSYQRINEIVKTRYETGAYGDAAFRLSQATFDRLKSLAPPPETSVYPSPARPFGSLLDIPILIDESLPAGVWQLRDFNGEVLYDSGALEGDEQ